jgi:hypothetical protein
MTTLQFKELLQAGEYSDFPITCQGVDFQVHKAFLGIRSEFFRQLFRGKSQASLIKFSSSVGAAVG